MIDQSALEREILSFGTEDVTGLYEVVWYVNGRYPDLPIGDKYAAADGAIRTLLSGGLVDLYRFRPLDASAPVEPIELVDGLAMLADPLTWYPDRYSEPPVQIAFMTTKAGEGEYYRRPPGMPRDPR